MLNDSVRVAVPGRSVVPLWSPWGGWIGDADDTFTFPVTRIGQASGTGAHWLLAVVADDCRRAGCSVKRTGAPVREITMGGGPLRAVEAAHCAYIGTLGLMECQKYVLYVIRKR